IACWRVSRSGPSMLLMSMPSSASSGASSAISSLAMPGLNWISGIPGGGSGFRRRISAMRSILPAGVTRRGDRRARRCTQDGGEPFGGSVIAQYLAGTVIQSRSDLVEVVLGQPAHADSLGQVLAQ